MFPPLSIIKAVYIEKKIQLIIHLSQVTVNLTNMIQKFYYTQTRICQFQFLVGSKFQQIFNEFRTVHGNMRFRPAILIWFVFAQFFIKFF